MPDLLLSDAEQSAVRALSASVPVPGMPLSQDVLVNIAVLIPCEAIAVRTADPYGCLVDGLCLQRGGQDREPPDCDGSLPVGITHEALDHGRRHWLAANGLTDGIVLTFRNATEGVVRLTLDRASQPFSERDLAVLRMIAPSLERLLRNQPTAVLPATLTAQERRVLQLLAAGLSNTMIADRLYVAPCTIRKHLEHAYRKLGVTNRLGGDRLRRPPDDGHRAPGTGHRASGARRRIRLNANSRRPSAGLRRDQASSASLSEVPMSYPRRAGVLVAAALIVTTPPAVALPRGSDARSSTQDLASAAARSPEGPQVVLDWEGYAFDAVYPLPTSVIPAGVPVLGFTSLTVYHAVRASLHRRHSSEAAAVATAAHDVLVHYAPLLHNTPTDTTTAVAVVKQLNARLAATLAAVPDGAAERRGQRIGHRAAVRFVRSRKGDHFRDPSIHYTLAPPLPAAARPGLWQATPPRTDMLEAWLGSLRPVVLHRLVRVSGPDGLRSYDYARDFNEVKRFGAADSANRSAEQTEITQFFNSNSPTMLGRALIGYLARHPMTLRGTSRLFGVMHGAMTDAVIKCWRLKRDVGFWRPSQAIKRAAEDGNPATTPDSGWTPLLPEPPYSDYVSGHGCLTSPATETIRENLGEDTALRLVSINPLATVKERDYAYLSDIETDALNSRIWGGLHFRDAMEDAYDIGRATARRVNRTLD